jgi:hypothetical protein
MPIVERRGQHQRDTDEDLGGVVQPISKPGWSLHRRASLYLLEHR